MSARDAVRQIGTNAIPALLRMLRYKESPLKRMLARIISKQSLVKFHIPPAHVPPYTALRGFFALGPAAKPAVPELVALLHNGKNGAVATYAGLALAGFGPEVLPLLTSASTNENECVRSGALNGLCLANPVGPLASESHRVTPLLITRLKDPNASIREIAAIALGGMLREPEIAVPALIQSLQWDPIPFVRARGGGTWRIQRSRHTSLPGVVGRAERSRR